MGLFQTSQWRRTTTENTIQSVFLACLGGEQPISFLSALMRAGCDKVSLKKEMQRLYQQLCCRVILKLGGIFLIFEMTKAVENIVVDQVKHHMAAGHHPRIRLVHFKCYGRGFILHVQFCFLSSFLKWPPILRWTPSNPQDNPQDCITLCWVMCLSSVSLSSGTEKAEIKKN